MATKEHDALLIASGDEPKQEQKGRISNKVIYSAIGIAFFLALSVSVIIFIILNDKSSASSTWSPPSPCDPLVSTSCYLPWPNDYFLSKSKNYVPKKLSISSETLPISNDNQTIDATSWNIMDGFSPLPTIMTYFENISLEHSNLARLWDVEVSLNQNSPIIILEVSTGKNIPYWTELDYSSDINGNGTIINTNPSYERLLLVYPAYRLQDGERYIVAMRNLKDIHNNTLNATDNFKYFRDNIRNSGMDGIEQRRKYFNKEIFDILDNYNIDISELQLAWDFTVQSTEMQTGLMINMKNDAFTRVLSNDSDSSIEYDVQYRITEIIDNPYDEIARLVNGQMLVPWYLNYREARKDVRVVTENDDNLTPVFQSMEWVDFGFIIPNSVANGTNQAKWIEYGHGLFGRYTQVYSGSRRELFDQYGYIGIAVDLLGMSSEDSPVVSEILTSDLSNFMMIPDRLHQGMLNYLLLNKLCKSENFLNDDDLFSNFNISNDIDDIVDVDTKQYYYGISQGGIFGSVLLALSDEIDRAVLDVPGYPYELLLPRSVDFDPFWSIIKSRYDLEMDRLFLLSFQQVLWNRLTPAGYISMINENDVQKNRLIHYSLGDSEVTWLGAYQMARTLDCVMFDSQIAEGNETIFGMQFIEDNVVIDVANIDDIDFYGNNICKIQGWDFKINGYPVPPFVNIPPLKEDNTHGFTSPQPTARAALNNFFTQGLISNTCNGSCNITLS